MLARHQSEKAGNLPHVSNQSWITQPSNQMRGHDFADAGQALEPGYRLPQFRVPFTEVTDILWGSRDCVEIEVQRPDQLVQLKAYRFRARQLEQLIEYTGRPLLLFAI